MRLVLWTVVVVVAAATAVVGTSTQHAAAAVGAAVAETEALTSASSLSDAQAAAEAASGFDPHKLYKPGSPGRGPCCRICPNIFYAVPRVVPRPTPAKPRFTQKQQREARFAAIFDRTEPNSMRSEDFTFIALAEQHSHSHSQRKPSPDRFTKPEYPEWPESEYTDDPYQDQPIPEWTDTASLPGVNCCNICPAPGIGQLKWPDLLRWGESPATDDFPQPYWDVPCCKLCSKGCYSNGEKRPPGVPLLGQTPAKPPSMLERDAASTNSTQQYGRRAAVRNGQTVLSETGASTHRKPRAIKMRGNWPKQMDPPGANKPLIQKDRGCGSMVGCCQVCYNHPMIYDHAPEGIY